MNTRALPAGFSASVLRFARALSTLAWRARRVITATSIAVLLVFGIAFGVTGYGYVRFDAARAAAFVPVSGDAPENDGAERAAREERTLLSGLRKAAPSGVYVVIDRINNRVTLRKGDEIILTGPCSTGSGKTLVDESGNRQWQFETPRGKFRVLSKTRDPIWKKPDWAFVEEGEPVPHRAEDRLEYGVLGEYGLYFGNGYLIHGTLYERLLGRSVSHGCIRVGKENLKRIYDSSPIGTAIYVH